ncbi:hypothetical protein IJ096_01750 [Candidatus Saccharibacteria bacterium]|nr:hypothetical protein [Candidatus Saccharibacteria bacterium]
MQLNRDQLLEIIDANNGNLDTTKIPIDAIPEDIDVPGVLKVTSDGNIHYIPAIKVGELKISSDFSREERRTIEIASGFQARNITIICHDNVVFGDNVKITGSLDIRRSSHVTFGDNLFVGREIIDFEGETEFGQQLRVGDRISVSLAAGPIRISEYSEVGFLHAPKPNSGEREHYPDLHAETIERLPAHSKFYCHVSGLAPGTQIDEDVYIAGNLYWGYGSSREDGSDNLPILKHALHIDGCLLLSGAGAEFLIPDDSRIGTLDICDCQANPIHLQLGTNVTVRTWPTVGGYILNAIPSQFKTEMEFHCGSCELNDIAGDAYFGSHVVVRKCPLEHWPIKHHHGNLDLDFSKVRTLEPGTVIDGSLSLEFSDIEELVDITVKGDLHIEDCSHLRSLQGTTVEGEIYMDDTTPVQTLQPENLAHCTGLHWDLSPNVSLDSLATFIEALQNIKGTHLDEDACIEVKFRES